MTSFFSFLSTSKSPLIKWTGSSLITLSPGEEYFLGTSVSFSYAMRINVLSHKFPKNFNFDGKLSRFVYFFRIIDVVT